MPEIKLDTSEIFQWKVNPSRRVPYERQNSGAFCSSLTEAISSQALLPPGEGQSNVLHQLQPGHSANTVYDNGSIRMHLKWRTLRHCATILTSLIKYSGSNQRKALLEKQHFLVLVFSLLSPVLYFTQIYFIISHNILHCQKNTISISLQFKLWLQQKLHKRGENVSYSRLPTVLLVSSSLAKGKTFFCAVSTAQCSGWQRDCGKKVLGISYSCA